MAEPKTVEELADFIFRHRQKSMLNREDGLFPFQMSFGSEHWNHLRDWSLEAAREHKTAWAYLKSIEASQAQLRRNLEALRSLAQEEHQYIQQQKTPVTKEWMN